MSAMLITAAFDKKGEMIAAVVHHALDGPMAVSHIHAEVPDAVSFDTQMLDAFADGNKFLWLGPAGTRFDD